MLSEQTNILITQIKLQAQIIASRLKFWWQCIVYRLVHESPLQPIKNGCTEQIKLAYEKLPSEKDFTKLIKHNKYKSLQ